LVLPLGPRGRGLQNHLVISARAPRIAAVKTRLAREEGDLGALQFYRRTCAAVFRRLAPDARWRAWIAVTPDEAANQPGLWPPAYTTFAQGPGDLGRRLAHILASLPPGPVVIVGSDIPDIASGHIAKAFRKLGANDFVFGPAEDGGYWLIGCRRRTAPSFAAVRVLFSGVRWSTEHALADTLANIPRDCSVPLLEPLRDIDTAANLAAWKKRR
jgi:rSAM/selenodomain-associated transferase 1